MKFTAQFLSNDEKHRIHKQTLRILEKVGVKFYGEKALPLLEKHGAKVDWESQTAHIPARMVEEALGTAPKFFTLGARNPEYNYPMPSPVTRYAMDGTAAFTLDFRTGEKRYGNMKDIEESLRIFQTLDMAVMAWAPVTASDKPAGSRVLHEFFGMARYTSKHGQHEIHHPGQVPFLIDGLIAIEGSEDALKRNHDFSMIYCPVSPLMHDGPMLDAYLELGRWNLPVMVLPMPVAGTTGPASLFSNMCLTNAEALSSIVIFQLAHPGRPIIYSSATGSVDFRKGAYLAGTPEMGIQSAALAELGHFYGLPSTSAGCSADAKEPGAGAILQKVITSIPPVCAGSEIIVGFGEIEGDQLLVLEQLIVDNEVAHIVERLYAGIDSSQEKVLVEDIINIGPGGNFLKSRNTRTLARSDEFYLPKLQDTNPYETWLSLGKPNMYSKAREQVETILSGPLQDPLPESVNKRLDEILSAADKELEEE